MQTYETKTLIANFYEKKKGIKKKVCLRDVLIPWVTMIDTGTPAL